MIPDKFRAQFPLLSEAGALEDELLLSVGPGAPPDELPPGHAHELGGRLGAEAEDAATCFICEGHRSQKGVGGFLGPPDAPGAPDRFSVLDSKSVARSAGAGAAPRYPEEGPARAKYDGSEVLDGQELSHKAVGSG